MKEITELFSATKSGLMKGIISRGGVVLGEKVENFKGVLVDDPTFAEGVAKIMEQKTGVKGFISTDELPKFGISAGEKHMVEKTFECGETDIVVLVADKKEKAEAGLKVFSEEIAKK
jgi:Glu-tRNA(Gln) amidotransferase subunit E-like FAD-binding protein